MTYTNNFNRRYSLSESISGKIARLFSGRDAEVIPFGFEYISRGNASLRNFIGTERANMSHSSMLVKFAPDFILLKKTRPQDIYFLEIKVSVTPLCYKKRIDEIKSKHPTENIGISDIGDIAREAWNAYKNLFPNTIILDACSYNPKSIMAQFVDKIECLRCYKSPGAAFDCAACPVENGGFFDIERNPYSQGSQTPHTNINYASFDSIETFFEKLNIALNADVLNDIKQSIKTAGVSFSSAVNDDARRQIVAELKRAGCDWL